MAALLDINGNIYAGRDGNVYRNTDSGWEKMGADNRFAGSQPAAGLDGERVARERGSERETAVNNFQRNGGFSPGGGDYGSLTRFGSMGARAGGGFRGGWAAECAAGRAPALILLDLGLIGRAVASLKSVS